VALAFVLGLLSGLPFLITFEIWTYALVAVAGLLVAWLVRSRREGLIGLLLGVAVPFTVWGGIEVFEKIQSCARDTCSGISSPNITVAIAVGLLLIGLVSGAAGYLAGRVLASVFRRVAVIPRLS
jgi:hypothetical protein